MSHYLSWPFIFGEFAVALVLDCDIVINEFELQSCYYVHIRSNTIYKIMDPSSHGLYRHDGLIIVNKSTPKKCDDIRKRLYKLFDEFGFRLDIRTDLKITDYLDVTLNL